MAGFEEGVFGRSHFEPYVWLCYLDDEKLKKLCALLKNFHPFKKFNM